MDLPVVGKLTPVQPTITDFYPVHVPTMTLKPFVVEMPKRELTAAQEVLAALNRDVKNIEGIVVLTMSHNGDFNILTDQGDDAGTIYFIERAKLRILERPPSGDSKKAS